MKDQKLLSVDMNLDKKFLKFYTAHYLTDNKPRDYFFVSRNDKDNLAINKDKATPTAVEAFTYRLEDDIPKIVMIKEFRSAVGKYVYSFCAGLIDKEDKLPEDAIQREIKEELGADTKHIVLLQDTPLYICPGLTDEANYFSIAEIGELDKQHLEDNEDIEVVEFEANELIDKVNNNELALTLTGYFGITTLLSYLGI